MPIPDILIAEDNPADVRLLKEALRPILPADKLHICRDGAEAMEFLTGAADHAQMSQPSLMFLDFHLPMTDPRDVLKYVKENAKLQAMAVVVLTTSNNEESIREAYDLGADCYLSKPSDLDTFFATIRSAARFWLNFPEPEAVSARR